MPAHDDAVETVPDGAGMMPRRRFLLLVGLASLGVTATVTRGIWRSYRGVDLAAERLAERRRYYETVLLKADLSFHPADFWEEVPE